MNQEKQKPFVLYYDSNEAPQINVRGEDSLAADILKEARKQEIPIEEDKALIDLLCQVKPSEDIPQTLYLAVAQLLTFLYYINDLNSNDFSDEEE